MKDVGEKFIPKTEAVAFVESGGDVRTNHNLSVGEREDVSRRGVAQMTVVETAAFPGGHQDHAELRG